MLKMKPMRKFAFGGDPEDGGYGDFIRSSYGLNSSTGSGAQPVPGATNKQLDGPITPETPPAQNKWITDPSGTAGFSVPRTSLSDRMAKIGALTSSIAPFASNVVNSFRTVPMPKRGVSNPYVTLQKVNLQNERNAVERTAGASNRATERNVDANTAEAIKAFNKGQTFSQLSQISDRENQANIGIANQQAILDSQTAAGNNAKVDEYNKDLMERDIARGRESSNNWANLGDKITAEQNEKRKGQIEMDKAKVLGTGLYGQSGVWERSRKLMKDAGIQDPTGQNYSDVKAFGGEIGRSTETSQVGRERIPKRLPVPNRKLKLYQAE